MNKHTASNGALQEREDSALSRRSFLKLASVAGGVGAVFGTNKSPQLKALKFIGSANAMVTPMGEWLPTTCQGCTVYHLMCQQNQKDSFAKLLVL